MNFVITGGAGHISKPLAETLLKAGHQVTVIGRNASNLSSLSSLGAKTAIGSVEDETFLTRAFAGADAVYTMVPPPSFGVADWKLFIGSVGSNYAKAIAANGIRYVVNLSSVGAHMADGCGPVSGLYRVEQTLNELSGTHILHLRPGFFYTNFLSSLGMIKSLGFMGGNYGGTAVKMAMVEPSDIARVAAEELLSLSFSGHSVKYVASDEKTIQETVKILGSAIGKPDLRWVVFSDEEALQGMLQAGLPAEIARNYAEMQHSIATGEMYADYFHHHPVRLQQTKLDDFGRVFAAAYLGMETAAAN